MLIISGVFWFVISVPFCAQTGILVCSVCLYITFNTDLPHSRLLSDSFRLWFDLSSLIIYLVHWWWLHCQPKNVLNGCLLLFVAIHNLIVIYIVHFTFAVKGDQLDFTVSTPGYMLQEMLSDSHLQLNVFTISVVLISEYFVLLYIMYANIFCCCWS